MARWHIAIGATLAVSCLPAQDLDTALGDLVGDARLRHARIGVLVRDLQTGQDLIARDAERSFLPASTAKLLTAAIALHRLGPGARLRTELVATGAITDGHLAGDLVVRGGGDPSFGDQRSPGGWRGPLESWLATLAELGVKVIDGDVVGDPSALAGPPLGTGWAWDDEAQPWSAQLSGLCFAGNCIAIELTARQGGIAVAVDPPTDHAEVRVDVVPGDRTELDLHRDRATNAITVSGVIARQEPGVVVRAAIEQPALHAARTFALLLAAHGIEVRGGPRQRATTATDRQRVIAHHDSPTIAELVGTMLRHSDNLHAEQLLRLAAGDSGDDTDDLRTFAARELASLGVPIDGLVLADGSGSSRYDQVTPRHLVATLDALWHGPHRAALLAALPAAGVDGTLAERMRDTAAATVVLAKTGSMSGVSCLSGLVVRESAAPVAFAILVNQFTCEGSEVSELIDRLVVALAISDRGR